MSEISLRAYIEYIDDRLSRDAHSEVVAQCRHILAQYPKYLEVYKLLARALMGQENYQDALDIFQRVLSGNPNDFVAHIGISDCYRESGALDQAIWHLERAFEQAPSNLDLQDAIKQLYQERDGESPRRVLLTAGALARLYTNGKLYNQAILELRKALTSDPERLDLQVLLVDALWENHQEVESGKTAAEVLRRLPYALDANRILAKLWARAEQPAEAKPFADRVKALDPYLGWEIEHGNGHAPADVFQLEMLDYTTARHATEVGAADWVSQIGSITPSEGGDSPGQGSGQVTDVFASPTGPTAVPVDDDTPDWLEDALGSSPMGQQVGRVAEAGVSPSAIDIGDLFTEEPAPSATTTPPEPAPTPPASSADEPDWLADVLSGSEAVGGSAAVEDAADTPDWLAEITGETPAPIPPMPAMPSAEAAPPGAPDSLAGQAAGDIQGKPAEDAPSGADAPEWLSEMGLDQPTNPPTPAITQPLSPSDTEREAPEWLDEILSGEPEILATPAEPSVSAPPQEVVSDEWLDELLGVEDESVPNMSDIPAEEIPSEPVTVTPPAQPPSPELETGVLETWDAEPDISEETENIYRVEPEEASKLDAGTGELDWLDNVLDEDLSEDASKDEDAPDNDAMPDWLGQAEDDPSQAEDSEPPADSDMPDWLELDDSGESPAASGEEQTSPDDIPDWLRSGDSDALTDDDDDDTPDDLPDWLKGGLSS